MQYIFSLRVAVINATFFVFKLKFIAADSYLKKLASALYLLKFFSF